MGPRRWKSSAEPLHLPSAHLIDTPSDFIFISNLPITLDLFIQNNIMPKGRPPASRAVTVSKALSLLLRHAAEKEGLPIDAQGYANVSDVVRPPQQSHAARITTQLI